MWKGRRGPRGGRLEYLTWNDCRGVILVSDRMSESYRRTGIRGNGGLSTPPSWGRFSNCGQLDCRRGNLRSGN
jgi:hypothetical protein